MLQIRKNVAFLMMCAVGTALEEYHCMKVQSQGFCEVYFIRVNLQ